MSDLFPGRAGFRQLKEWGFPQGSVRSMPSASKAFSVVHITGNPGSPIATAEGELAWRINDPANQNSATFFVNRDGAIWQGLGDPAHMAPWANGDTRSPDLSNPRIAACVRDGVNPNIRTLVAIENVGRPSDLPITDAQVDANRRILAYYHAKAGIPVNRETVIGHYQLNSVTRTNCPAIDKRLLERITASLPDTATEVPVLTRPVREKWAIPSGTTFYTAGPNLGDRKVFTANVELWSNGETTDGSWRRVEYGSEELWIPRRAMTAVPGTRNPATGYGNPTLGITQGEFDAAKAASVEEGRKAGFIDCKTKAVIAVQGLRP